MLHRQSRSDFWVHPQPLWTGAPLAIARACASSRSAERVSREGQHTIPTSSTYRNYTKLAISKWCTPNESLMIINLYFVTAKQFRNIAINMGKWLCVTLELCVSLECQRAILTSSTYRKYTKLTISKWCALNASLMIINLYYVTVKQFRNVEINLEKWLCVTL